MNYQLYPSSLNDLSKVKETVFKNRGFPVEHFDRLGADCVNSYSLLDNMDTAIKAFMRHMNARSNTAILVDCDVDGFCSGAMIYQYIRSKFPLVKIKYLIHREKTHGLSEDINIDNEEIHLLIIPDAGSNDVEQCKRLSSRGIDIIILDHHVCDCENPYAIVVNNQKGMYPNRDLCGTGVAWQFIRALDDENWTNTAEDFIDLLALATVSDNVDVTSLENRYLIDCGLSHIRNPTLIEFVDALDIPSNSLTGKDVQFCITPLINALIRVGDQDEKDVLFRALICSGEVFEYKKRKTAETIEESIYTRVIRLCRNAKTRQNRRKDIETPAIIESIQRKNPDVNKCIFANVTKLLDQSQTGVMAIKIAEHFNKPCILLRKKGDGYYTGSGRSPDNSPVSDMKALLSSTGLFKTVAGHPSAFGVEIHKDKIPLVIEEVNNLLSNIDMSDEIKADFVIDGDDLTIEFIHSLNELKRYCGSGFRDPMVVVRNIYVRKDQVQFIGENKTSWKIYTDDGVALVKFRVGQNDPIVQFFEDSDRPIAMTVAGECSLNYYKGSVTAQMIVRSYQIE